MRLDRFLGRRSQKGPRTGEQIRAECVACGASWDSGNLERCPKCKRTDTMRVHKTLVARNAVSASVHARKIGGKTGSSLLILDGILAQRK